MMMIESVIMRQVIVKETVPQGPFLIENPKAGGQAGLKKCP
jgi:hypothetical protein